MSTAHMYRHTFGRMVHTSPLAARQATLRIGVPHRLGSAAVNPNHAATPAHNDRIKLMSTASGVNKVSQSSYNANHEVYDKFRASYPEDAVELCASLAGKRQQRALEIGAGTGKFTKQVLEILPTRRYTATDPSEGMAQSFKKNLPEVKFVQAASTSLPFKDESFDVVYVAQAFHWFANRESLAEMHRVLSPGGNLVLLWNFEDDKFMPEWQRKTTEAVWEFDKNVPQYRKKEWASALEENTDLFGGFHERFFPYKVDVSGPQELWDYWNTRSFITALDDSTKESLKQKLFALTENVKPLEAARACHVVWLSRN